MAFGARGTTPVVLQSLNAANQTVWLSGAGFTAGVSANAAIQAATLVLDGLTGIGSSNASLKTAIRTLSGNVGSAGAFVANTGNLSIDSVQDGTGTRSHEGLNLGGTSSITTTANTLTINGRVNTTAGNLTLTSSGNLSISSMGSIVTNGTANLSLNAVEQINAASGSNILLNSSGNANFYGGNLVLRGTINANGNLNLATSGTKNVALYTYLNNNQKTALISAGVKALDLDGNWNNGEITSSIILDGTITAYAGTGFTVNTDRTLALLGDITTTTGNLSLSSSFSHGLLVLGSLSAHGNLTLNASAGSLRSIVTSQIKTTGTAGNISLIGGTAASLHGTILAGASSTESGPAWSNGSSHLNLTSNGNVVLAGATAVNGDATILAPNLTITASGGVISRNNLSLSSTGTATGQGLYSAGLLVAGGTVNTHLSNLKPHNETIGASSNLSLRGSSLQESNLLLDSASSASLRLSVSRDAADALVLGGMTSWNGTTQSDVVVAGA